DAAKGNLDGRPLRSRYGYKLEMIRECPRPIRNEVVLREANVRITTGKHLGYIPMSNAEATWEVLDLFCKEGVGRRFSDQPFDRSAVAGARSRLHRISLCDTCAGTRHIGEAMNSEWIAFADKQRAAAILREIAGLRF